VAIFGIPTPLHIFNPDSRGGFENAESGASSKGNPESRKTYYPFFYLLILLFVD